MPFLNDMLNETASRQEEKHRRESVVAEHTAQTQPLPSRFLFDPVRVMDKLQRRIVGQHHALETISTCLKVIKAEIRDPAKPLFVMLMLGPTGVGKTETVRVLAETLHGNADAFCRIDMNTLAQDHYSAALMGAPPGYVGSKEGTTLFNSELIQGSFSRPGIVLFDEIEKASVEVVRTLLNVLETGKLTLTSGTKTIDFRNTLIFMTSNLGAKDIFAYHESLASGWRKIVPASQKTQRKKIQQLTDAALHNQFDPEFINRIDSICLYNLLAEDSLDALISIEMEKLNSRLSKRKISLDLTDAVKDWLKMNGFEQRFGARSMSRTFRLIVEPALADYLIENPPAADKLSLTAELRLGQLHITPNVTPA